MSDSPPSPAPLSADEQELLRQLYKPASQIVGNMEQRSINLIRAHCSQREAALQQRCRELEYNSQWYPVKYMLPLTKQEGASRNYVLAAWVKDDKITYMRTCYCDSNGYWWLTPDVSTRTEPDYWRELPEGPLSRAQPPERKHE